MRVQREGLLKVLELLTPGLAVRETIAQSSCLVFSEDGRIMTFNEEVMASMPSPLKLKGAVKAKPLLDLLSKLQDDADLEIDQKDGELSVKGHGRKSGIRMEHEVLLPVEAVETAKEWRPLDPAFCEGIGVVYPCAGSDTTKFILTCVHIHPDFVEACDRFQIARFPMKTGVQSPVLVKAESIKKILGYDMTEVSETDTWIHFRNPKGLVLSLRRFVDSYTDLSKFLTKEETSPITLPPLEEVVGRAEIFSGENKVGSHVIVELLKDYIIVEGQGASGWYKERKEVKFNGTPMKFKVAPKLLVEINKKSGDCMVGESRLVVDTGKFIYVTCTVLPQKKEEAPVAA